MARRRGKNTQGRNFSDEIVNKVWGKAKHIPGKNPNLRRKDVAGNPIYKLSYGKDSEMGWQIDHKKPISKGGSDNLKNLQPLQTEENKEKRDQYPWEP